MKNVTKSYISAEIKRKGSCGSELRVYMDGIANIQPSD